MTTRAPEGSQQGVTPDELLLGQASEGVSEGKYDKGDKGDDDSEKPPSTHTRKLKIRQAIKDKGVFETGVEVVEHEVELDEDE